MYDIRHLFATTLLREGGDVAAVSKLMGHASVKMTVDRYYRLLEDDSSGLIELWLVEARGTEDWCFINCAGPSLIEIIL
jgi:integrase